MTVDNTVAVSTHTPQTNGISPDNRFDTKEAARYLKVISPATLTSWRSRGLSPIPFHRVGCKVVYLKSDLDEFLCSERVVQIPRPEQSR